MPTTTTNHYYLEIEGFSDFLDRRAERIVGLETPDDRTLVIRLTEPVADLPDRLAKGATAPIPPNPSRPEAPFGAAQGHGGGYGRFLIGTGPYMLEGSEDLDLPRPPGRQEPIAGYTPTTYDEAGRVLYLVMRLAVPPFDDHHVRRAVAHAIDEAALVDEITEDPRRFQEQWAVPFTHMAIDPLEGDVLAGYDPFPADPALARAEMSRSDYDDDRDGRCDASACRDVLLLVDEESVGRAAATLVAEQLRWIGVRVRAGDRERCLRIHVDPPPARADAAGLRMGGRLPERLLVPRDAEPVDVDPPDERPQLVVGRSLAGTAGSVGLRRDPRPERGRMDRAVHLGARDRAGPLLGRPSIAT